MWKAESNMGSAVTPVGKVVPRTFFFRNYRGNKQQRAAWAESWTWTRTQLHLTIRKVKPVGT